MSRSSHCDTPFFKRIGNGRSVFRIRVWGSRALWSDHSLAGDHNTLPVPTAGALVGLLEGIYWHPRVHWRVRRVHVLNQIRYMNEGRNELKGRVPLKSARTWAKTGSWDSRPHLAHTPRSATLLTDVHYAIEAELSADPEFGPWVKAAHIAGGRVARGLSYKPLRLGTSECPASIAGIPEDQDVPVGFYHGTGSVDLGWMLHHVRHLPDGATEPVLCRPTMTDGVIDFEDIALVAASGLL